MRHPKPNWFCYKLAQAVSWFVATFVFKRKFLRNEIRGKNGPFVVIANHEAAWDFVNLIGARTRPMTFVISKSFYSSLPIQSFLEKLGVIPKQQFQTNTADLKKMKAVVDRGDPLVIYPAGLMCEDGLSTPIPGATYKFLKWMNVDIYVARTRGTYFVMPKWGKGLRPGRTYMDIYKLFSKEELEQIPVEEVQKRVDEALLYDAYREQEELKVRYWNNRNIRGLENVLYMCPECGAEFSIGVMGDSTLCCSQCGFTAVSDEFGFLQTEKGQLRYVSDWSRLIYTAQKQKLVSGEENCLRSNVEIRMVDEKKHKFVTVGSGNLQLKNGEFTLVGEVYGEKRQVVIPAGNVPTLPFAPGRYLELQDGNRIYRCLPEKGALVMKFINMLKIWYELGRAEKAKTPA